jgi:hypothetical protein
MDWVREIGNVKVGGFEKEHLKNRKRIIFAVPKKTTGL